MEERVVRAALRMLRLLARVAPSRWRDSCLYRSAIECVILRALGHPAVVRLGVLAAGRTRGADVEAHAWVECAGRACVTSEGSERERFSLLRERV